MAADRYSRQISIPEFGEDGQVKLSSSSATVIGAGGLGSPVIYYLAAAGIGCIHIIDSDVVEMSNLNRQILHFEHDIGNKKTESAKNKINMFNSSININTSYKHIDESNIKKLIKGSDIVMSCVDSFEARYIINRGCVEQNIPMVDGGIGAFNGYTMTVIPGITPCYSCIFENANSIGFGVLGSVAGVVGSLMATQAIKYLLGIRECFDFILIDLINFSFDKIEINSNPNCKICGRL